MKELFVQKNIANSPIFSAFPTKSVIYETVMDAIAALPADDEPCTISIAPGVYREKITLQRSNVTLAGLGDSPADTELTFDDYAQDLMPDGSKRRTFRTYSFFLDADHVTLRNLTVSNRSGAESQVGQAIALYAEGDMITVENCRLIGKQDTLFTGPLPPKEIEPGGFIGPKQFAPRVNGRQYYKNTYICGNVDFIFGSATALFENCTIESVARTLKPEEQAAAVQETSGASANADNAHTEPAKPVMGYVTAPSTPEGQSYGYVFRNCNFVSDECDTATVYLGRPWRDFGQSVFLDCSFGPHIKEEGFHDWGKAHAREVSLFAVYNCKTHDGKTFIPTAPFAKQLSAADAAGYEGPLSL